MKETFNDLTEQEQREFLATVIHAIQNCPTVFRANVSLLELAEKLGIFNNTSFGVEKAGSFAKMF